MIDEPPERFSMTPAQHRQWAANARRGNRPDLAQVSGDGAISLDIARAPSVVDMHVATDDPAQFPERLQERRVAELVFRIVCGARHKHADAPHYQPLLRPRRERPRRRAA